MNIVNPDISIITSIGFDHCEILGDSLDKIAEEKAGIMRQNKPVIIGQGAYRPHLLVLAKQKQAQIYVRGKDFDDEVIGGEPGQALKALFPESIQLAIQALKLLAPKMALSAEKITQLLNFFPPVSLTGRFQSIHVNQVEWIIDVAHNSHAADWLAEKMNLLPKVKTTHIVWCSFVDKDVEGICSTFFNQLSPNIQQQSCWYMGKLAHIRTATQERLNHVNKIIPLVRCQVLETFEQALDQAYNQAKPGDRILVFGSFQAVSEALIFIQSVSEKAED